MNETILQILLILAYLAIGLIAVTFPIYAISVSYLPQEKHESEKEREKRIEKIKNRIINLTKNLSEETEYTERVAKIKEQIERYEIELTSTELKADYLTAKGAVRNPIIKLVLSLLTAGIGIFFFIFDEPTVVIVLGLISSGLSIWALYNLYKTISAVEYAALRPARTVEFSVELLDYKTRKQMSQIKLGKELGFTVELFTDDQDVENFHVLLTIPSAIKIDAEAIRNIPGFSAKVCENETVVCVEENFLPKGVVEYIDISMVPKEIGKHSLGVRVCGRNIHEYVEEFILKVVK